VFIIQFLIRSIKKNSHWRGSNRIPWGWNRVSRGSNRVLLTTWVGAGYCGVDCRMAPPSSDLLVTKKCFLGPLVAPPLVYRIACCVSCIHSNVNVTAR